MVRKLLATLAVGASLSLSAPAQNAGSRLEQIAQAMGADLQTIGYSASGSTFALGQAPNPDAPWPRFNLKSLEVVINYETTSMRQESVQTQAENPPRGGGQQPIIGERRQVSQVSGSSAWQIGLTPHGVIKAAIASKATLGSETRGGKSVTLVSFLREGGARVNALVNDRNLVERVETWVPNPILGDMLVETMYSDYKDFGGMKFPTRIVQKQGGFATLDVTVSKAQAGVSAELSGPPAAQQGPPPLKVETQKIAEGVWFLAGGSHNSVAIEFAGYVVVVEGPVDEARSEAVIAEVKRTIPSKSIRYLVNTHQHFDHSGGIRTYAAEGATIVTHEMFKPYYQRLFALPRTLNPDRLSRTNKAAVFETVADKKILFDATRTLELHHIKGNGHNDGMLMAYLPAEKVLIEADVYTLPPANTPPPATPSPFTLNFYENLQRLKLDVQQIAPLHGGMATMADLLKAIGKSAPSE